VRIERLGSTNDDYATGLLVPWFRAATHLAFAGAIISQNAELTNTVLADVAIDLDEAIQHLENRRTENPDAFVSASTVSLGDNMFSTLQEYTETIRNADAADVDRLTLLSDIQTIIHNAAWLCTVAEGELHGTGATPGRLL
jgi:hypothetical protein